MLWPNSVPGHLASEDWYATDDSSSIQLRQIPSLDPGPAQSGDLTGFCVIDSVVGGLTLSSVTKDDLTPTVGIVIIGVLALPVSFCGLRVLHHYQRYAWIPALIAITVATGCGGKHLHKQVVTEAPSVATILSFGALIAGFLVPWAALASNFAIYIPPETRSSKVFAYTYCGLFLPTVPLMVLGAAIGGAVPNVPSWQEGYNNRSVGGVLAAMLEPAGSFGKFLVVILSLTLLGNISATMYSITLNFQLLMPWLVNIPRALFSIVITAIVIPVSIVAATNFFTNLENFIGLIGYWAAAFVAVVVAEHTIFRRSDSEAYTHKSGILVPLRYIQATLASRWRSQSLQFCMFRPGSSK